MAALSISTTEQAESQSASISVSTTEQAESQSASISKIESLYDDDRFFDAVDALDNLQLAQDNIESNEKLMKVQRASQEINNLMREFESTEGWTLKSSTSSDDDVWYRWEEESGTHSFRVEGFVHAPLFNILALIYEFDLFPSWFPMMSEGYMLGQPSPFCRFARLVAWAPWPLANRECLLRGYGDIYAGNSVAIFATDAKAGETEDGVNVPQVSSENTRSNVRIAGFHFVPVSNNCVLVRTFFNIDPQIPLLPEWMLNLIIGNFCGALLGLMRKHASINKMIGSEHERRIKADDDNEEDTRDVDASETSNGADRESTKVTATEETEEMETKGTDVDVNVNTKKKVEGKGVYEKMRSRLSNIDMKSMEQNIHRYGNDKQKTVFCRLNETAKEKEQKAESVASNK
jgi:hypothetical protein